MSLDRLLQKKNIRKTHENQQLQKSYVKKTANQEKT